MQESGPPRWASGSSKEALRGGWAARPRWRGCSSKENSELPSTWGRNWTKGVVEPSAHPRISPESFPTGQGPGSHFKQLINVPKLVSSIQVDSGITNQIANVVPGNGGC